MTFFDLYKFEKRNNKRYTGFLHGIGELFLKG